ncbi:MAG: quinone-dependent dihydroorotate dehydrogenase [Verrucomicrobiota bacterium]|nr:quinone-dependent dihydroorotate dehydrogenase [Verrucomicrobiota bacterium]
MKRLSSAWYEHLLRPLLFQLDPETAHHLALSLLQSAPQIPGALALLRSFAPPEEARTHFRLSFRNPIGLAAGFDKNGVAIPAWEALGFGFVEIGTVTAEPQPGNPRPRIFRYPKQEALINRLGFNNDGAEVVAERLRRLRDSPLAPKIPIGINLGKSRAAPLAEAASDYLSSFRRLQPVADYIALNVSSPNTPGLRSLQEEEALGNLLQAVTEENQRLPLARPILLKIAPDLAENALEAIVALAEKFGLDGIIATNTTLDHSMVPSGEDQTGGLSGRPLRDKSTAFVRQISQMTQLPVIGVGGIMTASDAAEKLGAGAALLQIYTGYIYRGPGFLKDLSGGWDRRQPAT